jgi:hypothetical protein
MQGPLTTTALLLRNAAGLNYFQQEECGVGVTVGSARCVWRHQDWSCHQAQLLRLRAFE